MLNNCLKGKVKKKKLNYFYNLHILNSSMSKYFESSILQIWRYDVPSTFQNSSRCCLLGVKRIDAMLL